MSERIKLSIQLSHGDRLGVQHRGVHYFKRDPSWCTLTFESGQSISEYLVALCLARDSRANQHKTMSHHCCLVQLDTLAHKT